MQSIADLLKQKKNLSPLWRGVDASMIVEQANGIILNLLGPEAKNIVQAVYFKNAVLTLACLSSTTAQEIRLSEKEIIKKINNFCGAERVNKLRYLA